ncbi:YgaB family protein [Falsibacillus pallidus]|uniref:YgaB family protein n=1 Tax=Falsibacillus pallidus TaxID=493781 RepID=UPI003D963FC2
MSHFNKMVSEQLETMEKLLFMQSEIERCQELELELAELQEEAKLESVKEQIILMKKELHEIQRTFEEQTDEVIRSYQEMKLFA